MGNSPRPVRIDQLPEELLVLILGYLDSPAPSELNARDEPNRDLAVCSMQPLKVVSTVSKRWRRLALPILFKYACLGLDAASSRWQKSCIVCDARSITSRVDRKYALPQETRESYSVVPELPPGIDRYHLEMTGDSILQTTTVRSTDGTAVSERDVHHKSMLIWPAIIYHGLRQFLDFLQKENLRKVVQSIFVLFDSKQLELDATGLAQASDWRAIALAAFWAHLFSDINPARVAILAPPTEMSCITHCAINTDGDWAFGDMEYHFLELKQANHQKQPQSIKNMDYKTLSLEPFVYPGIATSSILRLRTWSHVSLNEASFLKAYGTYDFFERGPPSLVYSINQSLFVRNPTTNPALPFLASIEAFTYTAILPFSTHLDFKPLLFHVVTLDLQLAPLPESNILTDRSRVGRAELDDCWSELFSIYEHLVVRIATFSISKETCPRLQKFICRDVQIKALREELNEIFVGLCMPVWAELEPGVFTRLVESAR